MHVGRKIKQARKHARPALTQTELAHRIGLERSMVSRYEGREVVPHDVLAKVAEATGVSIEWLKGPDEGAPIHEVSENRKIGGVAYGPRGASRVGSKAFVPVVGTLDASRPVREPWAIAEPTGDYEEVSSYLLTSDAAAYSALRVLGRGLAARFDHGDVVLLRHDPVLPYGVVALMRGPDGHARLKAVGPPPGRSVYPYSLTALVPAFGVVADPVEWTQVGVVVAVLKRPGAPGANIEFDDGRPLRP